MICEIHHWRSKRAPCKKKGSNSSIPQNVFQTKNLVKGVKMYAKLQKILVLKYFLLIENLWSGYVHNTGIQVPTSGKKALVQALSNYS